MVRDSALSLLWLGVGWGGKLGERQTGRMPCDDEGRSE